MVKMKIFKLMKGVLFFKATQSIAVVVSILKISEFAGPPVRCVLI